METKKYYARAGDTLEFIAKYYGMSLDDLLKINPNLKNKNKLSPLDEINVPKDDPPGQTIHAAAVAGTQKPLWYAIAEREEFTGIHAFPDDHDPPENPIIVEYFSTTTYPATDDEVHWCSAFANWCLTQAKPKYQGTNSAKAVSWFKWGVPCEPPKLGCIVVMKRRDDPDKGHMGFYVQEDEERIRLLGGNQHNEVRKSCYRKKQIDEKCLKIDYRWPKEA